MTSCCDVEFCSVVLFLFVEFGCEVCGVLEEVVEGAGLVG